MQYVDEYRSPASVKQLAQEIRRITTKPWTIMEVCGGQTHSIVKYGIDQMLPGGIELIHGPGCPVCVTSIEKIDLAIALAERADVIFCSFGDMLRVPGTKVDLLKVKARGGDVRIVYSPIDALILANANPDRQVVFFAVGFETTAPANAMAVLRAESEGVKNFSLLVSHVLVPPALKAVLGTGDHRVQGFLAAGHVCTIMGYRDYGPIATNYRVPIVVTGFEPVDILHGVYLCIAQLEEGRFEVENQYTRSVKADGNLLARRVVSDVFEVWGADWRGIGTLPESGFRLRERYWNYDAERRFEAVKIDTTPNSRCQAGRVLTGIIKPQQCPEFGITCHPNRPLGAPMVSSEGACAAYFNYRAGSEHESR